MNATEKPRGKNLTPSEFSDWFFSHKLVDENTGCWTWTKGVSITGYGRVNYEGKNSPVHRISFYLTHGYRPHTVMHICDNPPCFNPEHLIAGNPVLNNLDMTAKRRHYNHNKTKCKRGHEAFVTRPSGFRQCEICAKKATSERWERWRAKQG